MKRSIKEKLQYGLIYKDIRKTYVIIIGILSLILSIGYISYASFSVQKEKSNGISIVTGNLIYNLQGKCITNNKIEIGPNETKEIEVTIESLNSIESCYQMYYQNNPNIEISYIESSDAPYQESIGTHPGDDYTKVTTIIIKNKTDEIQSVEIGAQGGLTGKELVLEEGRVKIEDIAKVVGLEQDKVKVKVMLKDGLQSLKKVKSCLKLPEFQKKLLVKHYA